MWTSLHGSSRVIPEGPVELTADDGHTYSGSDTLGDVAWYYGNSGDDGGSTNVKSHPVMTKSPNAKGIYDMSGNVYEWCWDKYSSSSSGRVVRGGSWGDDASGCGVSHRYLNDPYYRLNSNGFRVVRNAD